MSGFDIFRVGDHCPKSISFVIFLERCDFIVRDAVVIRSTVFDISIPIVFYLTGASF